MGQRKADLEAQLARLENMQRRLRGDEARQLEAKIATVRAKMEKADE